MEVQKIAGVAAVQPQQGPEPVQARTQSQTGDSAIPEKPRITPAVVYTSSSPNPRTQRDEEAASLLERMMEAQKKAKEQREKFRFPKNTNYGDRPMEAYARLSRARTRSQVGAAAGYARRQIAQLRAAKRQDSENAPRIQAAINQLEWAVVRAGRKKRELDQEQLTEARSRRLEEGKELKKAQTLRQRSTTATSRRWPPPAPSTRPAWRGFPVSPATLSPPRPPAGRPPPPPERPPQPRS